MIRISLFAVREIIELLENGAGVDYMFARDSYIYNRVVGAYAHVVFNRGPIEFAIKAQKLLSVFLERAVG